MSAPAAPALIQLPEFRRVLVVSGTAHLLLGLLLVVAPALRGPSLRPAPVFVEIVEPARPKPAPRPAPMKAPPKPAPRQVVDQPVVLKPKPRPTPEPKPRTEPRVEETPAPSAAELLARLRDRVGPEEAAARPAANGSRGRVDPLLAAYQRRVKAVLASNWTGVAAFHGQPELVAGFRVQLDSSGAIRGIRLERSSGNRFFDQSAERAIRRSTPFPSPPRGPTTLDVIFRPEGVL